jgi:hypothetical protein
VVTEVVHFQTGFYQAEQFNAQIFANQYDPNPAHTELPTKFVSGLYVLSLSNKAVLALPEFQNIQCARDMQIKFLEPVPPDSLLQTIGSYFVSRVRDNTEERQCTCFVMMNGKPAIQYHIAQIVRRTE